MKGADIEPPGIPMIAILARREGRRMLPSCGDGRREGGSESGGCNMGCVSMCWSMMPVRTTVWTAETETDAMVESRRVVWGERQRSGGLAKPWRVYEVFDFHRMRVLHKDAASPQ